MNCKCQRYPYGFYYAPILDTIENLLRDPLFRIESKVIVDASVNADSVPLNGLEVQSDSIRESSAKKFPDDSIQQQHLKASTSSEVIPRFATKVMS